MIASMAQAGQQSCQCLRILYLQQGRQGSWWCSDKGKYWHLLTFTCFQDIVKITETIVKSLRLHLACREFLLGISSAKISQELVEASPLSHLLPSGYTCLASSTPMISPFTSPPPLSLPFTLTPLLSTSLFFFFSYDIPHRSLKQQDDDVTVHFHRALEDPPFNSKNHLKSVMASGITWALLLVWTLSKFIWFKWSKIWIFGWDRPESPPTQEISKVEEGHDKTYNGLKFALSTFSS